MAVRKIIQIGNPALKAENSKITRFNTKKLHKLIQDLKDTMRAKGMVGMAAQQIAENYTVFVTEPRKTKYRTGMQTDKLRVFINPEIKYFSAEENIIYEGCGSVIDGKLFGPVKRPRELIIEAYDKHKNKFQLRCDGLLARVIQHEYDHLSGIEFTEKIHDYNKLMNYEFYKKFIVKSKKDKSSQTIKIKEYKKIS